MKLFGKSASVSATALVTDAAPPPQSLLGHHYGDWVWVVADLGSGPNLLRAVVSLPHDRWLLPGMRIPIEAKSDQLDHIQAFEVDFDRVPTIEELVAANDPVLADPRSARAAALQAAHGATQPAGTPEGLFSRLTSQPLFGQRNTSSYSPHPALDTSSWSAEFDSAVAQAAGGAPAAAGRHRAAAILVAMRIDLRTVSHNWDGTPSSDVNGGPQRAMRGNQTVLAVSTPGRAPYAVFVKHFQAPRDKPAYMNPRLYPWLPALVSDSDSADVEIAWDDVPAETEQIGHVADAAVDARIDKIRRIQEAAGVAPTEPPTPEGEGAGTLQGAIDKMMSVSAQQMAAAQQMAESAAAQQPVDAGALTPEAAHQAAVDAAQKMAPKMAAMPRAIRHIQVQQIKASLDTLAPETRDACLEIYRAAGVKM